MVTIGEYTGLRPRLRFHDGKDRYASKADAEIGIYFLKIHAALVRDGDNLQAYPCAVDEPIGRVHFHIGHKRRHGKKGTEEVREEKDGARIAANQIGRSKARETEGASIRPDTRDRSDEEDRIEGDRGDDLPALRTAEV